MNRFRLNIDLERSVVDLIRYRTDEEEKEEEKTEKFKSKIETKVAERTNLSEFKLITFQFFLQNNLILEYIFVCAPDIRKR